LFELDVACRSFYAFPMTDLHAYEQHPVTDAEKDLSGIADWGPAEDWADWAERKG
jgi:hypothetical protein